MVLFYYSVEDRLYLRRLPLAPFFPLKEFFINYTGRHKLEFYRGWGLPLARIIDEPFLVEPTDSINV